MLALIPFALSFPIPKLSTLNTVNKVGKKLRRT